MQKTLESTLHQTGVLLEQLDHLLDEEQETLRKMDYEALVLLSTRKNRVIAELNQTHQERTDTLKQLKLSHDQDGMREFIEVYAQHAESLQELWSQTQDKLQSCRQKNKINGTVILMNLQSNQRLLQLLKGNDQAQNLYNSQGQVNNSNSQQAHTSV